MRDIEILRLPQIKLRFEDMDLYLNLSAENDDELVTESPVPFSGTIEVDKTPDIEDNPYFVIYVTDYCNMNCSYCFNAFSSVAPKRFNPLYSSSDFIDFIERMNIEEFSVRFFGGEPLLNLDWIRLFVQAIKDKGYLCDYEIFTNASLIDDDFIAFSKENRIKIYMSVNGGADEYKGKLYANEISASIVKLCTANLNPYGRMVYSTRSEDSLVDLIQHPMDLGINMLSFTLPWGISCEERDRLRLQNEVKALSDFYIANILDSNYKYIGIHPIIGYIAKWILREKYFSDQCGAGKSVACISTSGDIYPCHCFNHHEIFRCGTVFSTYSPLFSHTTIDDMSLCKSCDVRFFCKSRCFADNYFMWGDCLLTNADKCSSERLLIAASAYILHELTKHPSEYRIFKKIIQMQRKKYDNN